MTKLGLACQIYWTLGMPVSWKNGIIGRACGQHTAHRTTYAADYNDTQLIRSICDEELIISIPNTVTGDDITLSMAEVTEEYVSNFEMTQSIPYRVSELEKNI